MPINEPFTPIPRRWTAKYGWDSKETMVLGELLERAYNAREVSVRTRDLCRRWRWRTASAGAFLKELERVGFCSIRKHQNEATILDFSMFFDSEDAVTGNTNSELHIEERAGAPVSSKNKNKNKDTDMDDTDFECTYCGVTETTLGERHQEDHFIPKSAGPQKINQLIRACKVCNAAKGARIFNSIEECRDWLHHTYWSSNRRRYQEHRKIAFKGEPPVTPAPVNIRDKPTEHQLFKEFYSAYPVHKARAEASKVFSRIDPSEELVGEMLLALDYQRDEREARQKAGKFVPDWKHPATWLSKECWKDEIDEDLIRAVANGTYEDSNAHSDRPLTGSSRAVREGFARLAGETRETGEPPESGGSPDSSEPDLPF